MCPRTCDRARSAYTLAARTHSNARARTHARRHACTHARTHALCGTECEALEWRGEYARLYCNSPLWPPLGRCCARRRCCTLCTSRDGSSSVRACGLRFPFASARWLRLPARSVGNKFRFSFGAFCWCLLYSMRGQEFRPQICGWLAWLHLAMFAPDILLLVRLQRFMVAVDAKDHKFRKQSPSY